jgi:O-antigen ligase
MGAELGRARIFRPAWLVLMVLMAGVSLVLTLGPMQRFAGLSWHDSQRLAQLLLLLVLALLVLGRPGWVLSQANLVPRPVAWLLAALAMLGLASAAWAHYPQVAFVDVGLWLGCALLAWALAALRARVGETADPLLLLILLVPVLFYALGFWFRYLGLVLVAVVPDQANLLEGFQNRRFMSQWQTPLLAAGAGLVLWVWPRSRWAALVLSGVLAQWWCINIWTGSRSTLLGLLVAGVLTVLVYPGRWRWLAVQAALLGGGLALYWFSAHEVLSWLGLAQAQLWEGRMTAEGLANPAGRDLLFREAWRQGLAAPWLGSGPAHFVDVLTADFAHPHNLLLQFFAEWGLPATVLLLVLLAWLACHGWRSLRRTPNVLTLALAGGVAAALAHAMTDGIHVMPLGQLEFAVFVGWLLGVLAKPNPLVVRVGRQTSTVVPRLLALLLAAAMGVALAQVPGLRQQQDLVASIDGKTTRQVQFLPRTWQNGILLQPSELLLPRRRRAMP